MPKMRRKTKFIVIIKIILYNRNFLSTTSVFFIRICFEWAVILNVLSSNGWEHLGYPRVRVLPSPDSNDRYYDRYIHCPPPTITLTYLPAVLPSLELSKLRLLRRCYCYVSAPLSLLFLNIAVSLNFSSPLPKAHNVSL